MHPSAKLHATRMNTCRSFSKDLPKRTVADKHQAYLGAHLFVQFGVRGKKIKNPLFPDQPSGAQEVARGQAVANANLGRTFTCTIRQSRKELDIHSIGCDEYRTLGGSEDQ